MVITGNWPILIIHALASPSHGDISCSEERIEEVVADAGDGPEPVPGAVDGANVADDGPRAGVAQALLPGRREDLLPEEEEAVLSRIKGGK
jgi:hypothetical protein